MKECKKCAQFKEESKFNKNKSYKDGLRTNCKKCQSKYNHDWFQNNRNIRNTQKLRDEQNHPERRYARHLAWKETPLLELCELCPEDDLLPATQRHHPDYNYPLLTVSCCDECHTLQKDFGKENER